MYKPLIIGDLKAEIPIVQGGMGVGISLEKLAGAVAAAGGVGILSAAQMGYHDEGYEENPLETNLKAIKTHIEKAKELSGGNGIIGINIMVATKYYERYVKAAVEAKVPLIVSGAGLPVDLPGLVSGSDTKIAPIVSSEKSAKVICKYWDKKFNKVPDLVVIEGPQAGGHLGFVRDEILNLKTDEYCLEIKKIQDIIKTYEEKYETHIPIVMAGGIYTAEDVERYMALGIDGVQVSTRFVTTFECDASDAYKNIYLSARKEDIEIVSSPVGMPGRAIKNPFIEKVKQGARVLPKKCYQCVKTCNQKDMPYCISQALINAAKGDCDNGLIFCGAKAYMAEKIENVTDVIKELMQTNIALQSNLKKL